MKRFIIPFFVIIMIFGCSNKTEWTKQEKEQVFGQTLDVVNLYTSGKIKPISESSKEHLEVTICTLKKILNSYSYSDYLNSLTNSQNDTRPEAIELKKFRLKALVDCNIKFTELGYSILVMQGLMKPSEIPK